MIRLRLEHNDDAREYAFHRTQVCFGRSPMNDLPIPIEGIPARQGTLTLADNQLVVQGNSPVAEATLLRSNQKVSLSSRQAMLPGDVLVLKPDVRLVLLGVHDPAAEARGAAHVEIPAEGDLGAASSALREALLPLSLDLHRNPDAARLLHGMPAVLEGALGITPTHVQLLLLSGGTEPERLVELDEAGDLVAASRPLELGTNKRVALVEHVRNGGLVHYPSADGHTLLISPCRGCRQGGVALVVQFGPVAALQAGAEQRRHTLDAFARAAALFTPLLASVAAHRRAASLSTQLRAENRWFRDRQRRHYLFKEVVAESPTMRAIYRRLNDLVDSSVPVLLTGEAGTGKELVARALHHLGVRKAGLLVAQSCAEVSEEVLDVLLFGSVGDPVGDRVGIFELADGGTVFLDDIDRLPLRLQSRVLRVIKEGEVRRHGEELARAVNVRVVATTRASLAALVTSGTFRKDLYLALHDNALPIPSLRDRQDDIIPLLHTFLDTFARRHSLPRPQLDPSVEPALKAWPWPGNVRELQSAVEAALLKNVTERPLLPVDFGVTLEN